MTTEFGVHLPLIDFGQGPHTVASLSTYARAAAELEFRYLCANDHLVFRRPWLDGPTALAAVLPACPDLTIATTVALPVVRGPVATAKMLAALHDLSGGRLLAGVGPGSSAADFAAAGVPFGQRWPRFDESVRVLRILLGKDPEPFHGTFYAADAALVEAPGSLPLWVSSWGSTAGIRRVARLGDGWLASAYNSSPEAFRSGLGRLETAGRPMGFPNAVATMWLHVTERRSAAERVVDEVLAPLLNRTGDELRARGLPIGSAEQCAERISAYQRAGAQRIFLWPLGDEIEQLTAFRTRVLPQLPTSSATG